MTAYMPPSVEIGMVKTTKPGPEARRVEVEEQSRWAPRELQVCNHLGQVNRMNPLYRLEFKDYAALHEKIDREPRWNLLASVMQCDPLLDGESQVRGLHFENHTRSVDRFEQTGAQRPVDSDGTSDQPFRQCLYLFDIMTHDRAA
jgi:hypothetical protein